MSNSEFLCFLSKNRGNGNVSKVSASPDIHVLYHVFIIHIITAVSCKCPRISKWLNSRYLDHVPYSWIFL